MCVLSVIAVKGETGGENTRGKDPWEPADLGAVVMAVQREQGHREHSGGTSTAWLATAGSRERWPGDRESSCEESSCEAAAWRQLPRKKEQSEGLARSQGRRRCPGVSRPAGGHQEARSRGQRATRRAQSPLGWKWGGPGRWRAGCAGEWPQGGSRAAGECGAGAPG